MSTATVYFISGGNRGIGFSFVKQLSTNPQNLVIVSARNPENATELQEWSKEHDNTKIVKLDVSNKDSIASLPDQVSKFTDEIDVLISNAGIGDGRVKPLLESPGSELSRYFEVNSIGPVLLVGALEPFLSKKQSSKIVFISSLGGSVAETHHDVHTAYGASKVVLNYYMKVLSIHFKKVGTVVVSFHPGFVETDMTRDMIGRFNLKVGDQVDFNDRKITIITPEESVSSMLKVLKDLTIENSGSFLNYDGEPLLF